MRAPHSLDLLRVHGNIPSANRAAERDDELPPPYWDDLSARQMRVASGRPGPFDVGRECPEPSISSSKRSWSDDRLCKAKLNERRGPVLRDPCLAL